MSLILSGTDGLSDVDGSAATPSIRGTDANTGIFFPAADTIAFSEGGAEVARFNSSGNLQTIGTIGVGNATPSTSGAGITFPATQSASSDANTLDDYEEGDWTPSVGGNATYTSRSGRYVKIGKSVSVLFDIQISVLGTGNANQIINVPFTAESNSITNAGSIGFFSGLATSVVSMYLRIDGGNSAIIISGMTAAGTAINTNTIFQDNTRFTGCITYITQS